MIRLRHCAANMDPFRGARKAVRSIRATETGQSLVEFAMVLPLFLVLLFGLVDFGRAFYSWMVITNGAREGARAGAVQKDWPTMKTAIYGSMCNPYPGSCSLDTSQLTLTPLGDCAVVATIGATADEAVLARADAVVLLIHEEGCQYQSRVIRRTELLPRANDRH